jgi:DinB family protein
MNRDRIVQRLEENCRAVASHFEAPATELQMTYAPGKWTVLQILAHLADCETISVWRFGRAVAEPGSSVEAFEQDSWNDRLDYLVRPVALSRDMFLAARRMLIHHVRTLPDDRLRTTCNHSEKGKLDGYTWADVAAAHAEHHLGQIEAARSGRPWTHRSEYAGPLYGAGVAPGGAPG